MALGPIDYSSSVADPWQGLPQYLAVGQQIRAMFERRDAEKAAAAQQQQYEADVREAMQDPTPKAFAALSLKYPKLHEPIGKAWASLSADQQQNELRDMGELSAALGSGRGDIALARIDERIAAMHNSGQDVSKLAKLREVVQTDPKNAYGFILGKLAAIPGGDKVLENLGKIGQEQRAAEQAPGALRKVNADASAAEADATKRAVDAKYAEQQAKDEIAKRAADLGLTKAQTSQAVALTSKYDAETRETLMKLQQIGKPTPQQQFEAESKLRGEYTKATEGYTGVTEAYRRLKASNNDAAGDLSLIFSYMKMLDPGSVVREGEFATAQNAAGVPDRVRNLFNRLLEGQRLTEGQRKQFTGQAESLYTAAQKRESEARAGLSKVARNYGLNAENIFGGRASEQPGGTPNPDRPPIGQFDLTEGR